MAEKKRSSAFKKPNIEDISLYCSERGNGIDPEAFYDFYESKGWFIGKNKMKDWQAAVRTWERRKGFKYIKKEFKQNTSQKTPEKILLEAGIGLGWLDRKV